MFARPDVRYHSPGLPDLYKYGLGWRKPLSIALSFEDRFAVGIPDAVEVWANRGSFSWQYMNHNNKTRPLHSESLVLFALERSNITAVALPLCFERVRANGNIQKTDQQDCHWRGWSRTPWRFAKKIK